MILLALPGFVQKTLLLPGTIKEVAMSLTKKMILLSVTGIIVIGLCSTFISLHNLKKRGQADIEAIQRTLMEEKKERLKDLVSNTFAILETKYKAAHDPVKVAAVYHNQLKSIVEVAYKAVESVYNRTGLSPAEKKQNAMNIVKAMRYNGKGYLWINDTFPRMVMHPIKPALDGKDLSSFKDPQGKKLFVEFVKVCRQKGEGTVDYLWPKPGFDKPVPKLSYVKLFKPWNWIIGTGVYLEAAEKQFKKDAMEAIGSLRFGRFGKDYFWINDINNQMVMHPIKPSLNGKDLSDMKDSNGKYFFREFVRVCKENGAGFVDYLWPKPDFDKPVPKLSYVKLFDKWGWIVGTGVYLDDVNQAIADKQADMQSELAKQLNWTIASMVAALLVVSVLVTIFSRQIAHGIVSASSMLKDIADGEGDLTRKLEVKSKDEIGEMAYWFNHFVDNVRNIIAQVKKKSNQLDDSSGDLAEIAEHMSGSADQTSAKASNVAQSADTMSSNTHSVAAAMEEAATNMGMVATAAEEMTSVINEIAENTEKASSITSEAVSQTGRASQQVAELGQAAQEIGKVIETITEISEQVNLLALNATIEAARAGDAGKGFAVVANEIKELARQTAEATGEIKQRVEGIQSSTEGTVTEIGNITEIVNQVNEIVSTIATAVEEQSVSTKEIASNVNQASEGIGEVNEKVSENSNTATAIADEIAEVTQAASEMANSSGQVNLRASELSDLARQLKEMVGRFSV